MTFLVKLLSLELCLHFKKNKIDILEYGRASLLDVQQGFGIFI